VSVTAPPRPPDQGDPVSRKEIEALVEALIEEARREQRRRHRRYLALTALAASVGAVVLILLAGGAASQTASPTVSARMNAGAQAGTSTIAFISAPRPDFGQGTNALYVVNADGSEKRLLSRRVWWGSHATWSPDGKTIGVDGLFINADGSGQRSIGVARERGLDPVWSPDGRKIAFVSGRDVKCRGEIYVMNADGRGLRRLTRNGLADALPMWSPNGTRIAFLRFSVPPACGGWAGDPGPLVYVMNADGSGQRRLARGWPSAWSADGRKIAFTGPDDRPGMYVMNADGSAQRRLNTVSFPGRPDGGSAAWSPDGQKILFVRARRGTRAKVNDIYVMNADGSGQRKLTERGHDPRWSPDGEKISFVTNRDGNNEIYVMNADGSGQVNVSHNPDRDDHGHAWSPGH
jgi:Tol biopolymer transport system component